MKTITLDATQLSSGTFSVSGAGQLSSNLPQSVELEPGMHTFGSPHGPLFAFEVAVDGTIDYPAGPMDGFLGGRGTTTLRVKGYTITLDATALSLGLFALQDASTGWGVQHASNKIQTFTGIPGRYQFGSLHGPSFAFEITVDGTIDYAAGPMDGFLGGRGTTTLRVKGYTITLDATALSLGLFALQDARTGWGVQHATNKVQTFTGIPGSYQFGSLHGPSFAFKIRIDGTIGYPAGPMDSYLAGGGSTTLRVYGYLVGIDASRLAPPSFRVSDPSTGNGVGIDTDRFHCISLLPGTYEFACGFTLGFVVEGPGVFTYDRTLEPALTGYHTQRLHVVTDPAAVPVAP